MADAMNFGPEWLRNLSSEGTTTGAPKYQLAEHRYGREEMLALFDKGAKPPDSLKRVPDLFVEKIQVPTSLITITEEELRLWNRGINSDATHRGKAPAAPPGMMRGTRGASGDRGRGRGRGTGGYFYSRGNYDEGDMPGKDGGPMERPYLRQSRSFDRTQMGERNWPERNGAEASDWNGSTSPRKEYGGPMRGGLDNWRRTRDDEDGWRQKEKWTRPSWREEGGEGNNGGGRSSNWGRGWADEGHQGRRPTLDEMPEWANVDSHEPSGSFDASGAFHGYSSDEIEGQSDGPSIRRIESARAKLFSDGSGDQRNPVSSNEGAESGRKKNAEDEAPSGLTRSKTSADLGSAPPQAPPNTITKSASSAALSESQAFDRIRTQHQNFVTKSTDPTEAGNKKAEKNSSNKPVNHSQQYNVEQSAPQPRTSPVTQAPPLKPQSESIPAQPPQQGNRKRDSEGQGVPRQGSEDDMARLSMTVNSVVRLIEEEPSKTLKPPPSESDMWIYTDPQGNEQGPFRSSEMLSWYSCGYFLANLQVRRVEDDRYHSLGELTALNGGLVPFSTTPAPTIPTTPTNDSFNPYQLLNQQQLQQQQLLQQIKQQHQMKLPDIDVDLWKSLTQAQKDSFLAHRFMQQQPPPIPAPAAPNPYNEALNSSIAQFMHQFQQSNQQLPPDVPMSDPVRAMLLRGQQPTPPAPHHLPLPVMPHIPPPNIPHQLPNSVLAANAAADLKDAPMQAVLSKLQSATKAGMQPDQQQPSQRSPVDSLWSGPGRPMSWSNGLTSSANPSPLWNVKSDVDVHAAEQQKHLQLLAEERRQKEEKRKLEEARKKEEAERKEREVAEERRRQEEEERKRREQEETLKLQQEKEEKERKKLEEARKKEEKRKKEDLKKLDELQKKKEEEREKRRLAEEERRKIAEERLRLEKEIEEDRRRTEEIAQQQQEQQRRQEEALQQLKQQQLRSRMKPWTQTTLTHASLAEIQAQEKEKKWIQQQKEQSAQEMILAHAAAMEMQARENEMQNSRSNGFSLKWAEQPPPRRDNVKSLAEIQAEEQKQLMKQQEREREERALQQRDIPATAGIWGGTSGLTWANQNSSPWGGVTNPAPVTSGFWDDATSAAKFKTPQSPVKSKAQVNSNSSAKKQSKTNSKPKPLTKRDEAAVLELFKPQGDEFTNWCISTLHSMQTSIDVPTFAAFLRDVDNPFEVKDYVKQYLGESAEAGQFANQFLERRSRWKSSQKSSIEEDDMCAPAPAINPTSVVTDVLDNGKKGKKAKKGKMLKVDSRILGFNVTAAPNRINVGQRETWDPNS